MKILLTTFLLLIALNQYSGPVEIGYLVYVDTHGKSAVHKVKSIESVNKILSNHFPGEIKAENFLYNSNHLELETNTIHIYIERKRIVRKGGKVRFRKIKK